MADRIIHGTLDTFNVDTGSEITYKGPGAGIDRGLNIRSFEINPAAIGLNFLEGCFLSLLISIESLIK